MVASVVSSVRLASPTKQSTADGANLQLIRVFPHIVYTPFSHSAQDPLLIRRALANPQCPSSFVAPHPQTSPPPYLPFPYVLLRPMSNGRYLRQSPNWSVFVRLVTKLARQERTCTAACDQSVSAS